MVSTERMGAYKGRYLHSTHEQSDECCSEGWANIDSERRHRELARGQERNPDVHVSHEAPLKVLRSRHLHRKPENCVGAEGNYRVPE